MTVNNTVSSEMFELNWLQDVSDLTTVNFFEVPQLVALRGVSKSRKAFIDRLDIWNAIAVQIGAPTTTNVAKPYEVIKKIYKYLHSAQYQKHISSDDNYSSDDAGEPAKNVKTMTLAQIKDQLFIINQAFDTILHTTTSKHNFKDDSTPVEALILPSLPPKQIGNFANLKRLTLFQNYFSSKSSNFVIGINPAGLDLYNAQQNISILPNEIGSLTNLQSLTFSKWTLTFLPIEISKLNQLTELNLSSQRLKKIDCISHLNLLTTLDLSNNKIEKIDCLAHLNLLTTLDLSKNKIEKIDCIHLVSLITLNLSENCIRQFPQECSSLTNLTYCNMSSNRIASIDAVFGELLSLKVLALSNNYLHGVVSLINFSAHTQLKTLNLNENKIDTLTDLKHMKSITQLNIKDNSIIKQPTEITCMNNLITLIWDHSKIKKYDLSALNNLRMIFENKLVYCDYPEYTKLTKKLQKLFDDRIHQCFQTNTNLHAQATQELNKLTLEIQMRKEATSAKRKANAALKKEMKQNEIAETSKRTRKKRKVELSAQDDDNFGDNLVIEGNNNFANNNNNNSNNNNNFIPPSLVHPTLQNFGLQNRPIAQFYAGINNNNNNNNNNIGLPQNNPYAMPQPLNSQPTAFNNIQNQSTMLNQMRLNILPNANNNNSNNSNNYNHFQNNLPSQTINSFSNITVTNAGGKIMLKRAPNGLQVNSNAQNPSSMNSLPSLHTLLNPSHQGFPQNQAPSLNDDINQILPTFQMGQGYTQNNNNNNNNNRYSQQNNFVNHNGQNPNFMNNPPSFQAFAQPNNQPNFNQIPYPGQPAFFNPPAINSLFPFGDINNNNNNNNNNHMNLIENQSTNDETQDDSLDS